MHYLDKLEHVQVIINCWYSVAQMCTREDTLAHYLGAPSLNDIMSHNELTTITIKNLDANNNFCVKKSNVFDEINV